MEERRSAIEGGQDSAFAREQARYLAGAEEVILAADERGIQLRLLGAIAVIKHCPHYIWLHEATNRELTDIDVASYSNQSKKIETLLGELGYRRKGGRGGGVTMEVWTGREIFSDIEGKRPNIDVFYDRLDFCHPVEFQGRLHLDSPTIPLTDLVLEKLQIVEINEKDLKDLMILFLEHPIDGSGSPNHESVDAAYVADLLAKDWGFYYTVGLNLDKVLNHLPNYAAFSAEHRELITERIEHFRAWIEDKPKTLKWKLRARVGPKKKWYRDVGEEYRELHAHP